MESRQSYNIFNKYGQKVIWEDLKTIGYPYYGWKILFKDSFNPSVCYVFGHKPCFILSNPGFACSRCFQELPNL